LKREPEPESWAEWGQAIGHHYADPWTKREPETWAEWGKNIGNYYSNKYSTPDSVPGLPHY